MFTVFNNNSLSVYLQRDDRFVVTRRVWQGAHAELATAARIDGERLFESKQHGSWCMMTKGWRWGWREGAISLRKFERATTKSSNWVAALSTNVNGISKIQPMKDAHSTQRDCSWEEEPGVEVLMR